MHQHDADLIQALAEGGLSGAAASPAEAEIAACPQCTHDLELQRLALDALGAAPRRYLTAGESARLRSEIRKELKLGGDVIQLQERRRRRFPLGALAGAAAVLLAVVVVAPQLNLLGSGDDDSVLTLEELGDAVGTPVPATEETDPPLALAPPAPELDAPALQAPERGDTEFATSPPDAALAAAAPPVDLEALLNLYVEFAGAIPPESLAEAGVLVSDAADSSGPEDVSNRLLDESTCDLAAAAGGDEFSVLGLGTYGETLTFVVVSGGTTPGDVALVLVDPVTCEVLEQR